ncbi:MFS transporter [Listeria ilorinensis]|uniref:MFS transporter n=1 Tax=Listeria ilorinensis TaxID=2867439 RepID=UPI001EF66C77|nr:MFS transporter [Listeria ilorinensis]
MKPKNGLFKVSLLSISLLLMAGPAIAATIPLMAETFQSQSASSIELLSTIPNFGIILFVLVSNYLVKLIGDKKTVLTGLLIALIFGIVPVFSESYGLILFSRFMLGAGIGLINPLAYSLITHYFIGEERATMLGYQNAVSSIGSAALTFIVGLLVQGGWHTTYLVYLIAIPAILLFGLFVPETKHVATERPIIKEKNAEKTNKIHPKVFGYAFLAMLIFASFITLIIKLSTFASESGVATVGEASIILSLCTVAGIISSPLFGKIFMRIKFYTLSVGLFVVGLSFVVIALSTNLWVLGLGALLGGLAFALVTPYLFMQASQYAAPGQDNIVSSILLVGINIGTFIAPYFAGLIGILFGNSQAYFAILMSGVILLATSIIHFLVTSISKK